MVRSNKERFHAQYLAWLHAVGAQEMEGVSLRERTQLRRGFSYWWMTLPAEDSLEPDSPTYGVVRLLALSEYAEAMQIQSISLHTGKRDLISQINEWVSANGKRLDFDTPQHVTPSLPAFSWRKLRAKAYGFFPPLAALRVLLGHCAALICRPKSRTRTLAVDHSEICVIDYMAHLTHLARTGGSFDSQYWGPLIDYLRESQISTLAIHLPARPASRDQIREDTQFRERFNQTEVTVHHAIANDFITWSTLRRAIMDFLRIAKCGWDISHQPQVFFNKAAGTSCWPLVKNRFHSTFFGRDAMNNAIYLNLFEEITSSISTKKLCLYLCENQAWEMALIRAWQMSQQGSLVGVIHSTIPFWNTRLLKDERDLNSTDDFAGMPAPDTFAVNGVAMQKRLLNAGYARNRLQQVEALRYLYLSLVEPTPNPEFTSLLVLGEYSEVAERHLIDTLVQALNNLKSSTAVVFRAHPTREQPIPPKLELWTASQQMSLHQDLTRCSLAICGPSSSAAVDAIGMFRPVIIVDNAQTLASSPAEGLPGCFSSHSVEGLASEIDSVVAQSQRTNIDLGAFFDLDLNLPLWRDLIEKRLATGGKHGPP